MKNLIFALFAVALFTACNNGTKTTNTTDDKVVKEECSPISVDSFLVVAPDMVGKEVTVMGTVDHVCKHGGKKAQLFSSCPSKRIFAFAGESFGNFKAEIEGSSICVIGKVIEIKKEDDSCQDGKVSLYSIDASKYHECGEGCCNKETASACCKKSEVAKKDTTAKKGCCDKKSADSGCKGEKKASEGCKGEKKAEAGCKGKKEEAKPCPHSH